MSIVQQSGVGASGAQASRPRLLGALSRSDSKSGRDARAPKDGPFARLPWNGSGGSVCVIALAALALAACQAQPSGDEAFGKRVRAYLLSHPEVLQEVSQRLDAKLAAADDANRHEAQARLPALRAAIERDPADFVANPGGRITVTEFYDYRCPHCAAAAPAVMALVRTDPDVRFVFKEMPIFGPTSEHAARAALAVKKAGGDSLGIYSAFMNAHPLDDATIDRLARARGASTADLAPSAATAANAQLARTAALFSKLALDGTPAFIVGDRIILGDDMASVNAAVSSARGAATGQR